MQFAKSDEGYVDPLSAEVHYFNELNFKIDKLIKVTGNNLLALCLEAVIFLSLNLILEIFMDENIPTSGSNSINILSIENVTKYYRTLTSKFKAVDKLR